MESELIRAAQAGDQQAWATLKDSVAAVIQEKIFEAVAVGMEVEEAEGDAALLFVEAVNSFDFSKSCKFVTHLTHTLKEMRHCGLDRPRSNRGVIDRHHMPSGDSWAGSYDDNSVDDADEVSAVREKVKALPAWEQKVINGLLAGRTHAELAGALGVSARKVKQIEERAHERLRGMLK